MEVSAKNISAKSLFKLYFKSLGYGLFLFSFAMGILALFGFETVTWNDEALTGLTGLLASIPMGIFIAFIFTCLLWFFGIFGLLLNSSFSNITIVFKTDITGGDKPDV